MSAPRPAGTSRRHVLTIALVACGVALPFVRVAADRRAFVLDIDYFRGWADCLSASAPGPYVACTPPSPLGPANYPALGVVASGGAAPALADGREAPAA